MTNPLSVFDSLVVRFDTYQRSHPWASFLYAVLKKYLEDEAGHRAALLAYYGFLSIFPLLLVLTSVLNIALRNNTVLSDQFVASAVTYFPAIGHDLQQNVHMIGRTGVALVVGILLTLFGARGVADVLRSSLDHIWQIPHARRSMFPAALFRSMAILVVGGLSLVIAPIISSYIVIFGHNWFTSLLSALVIAGALFWVIIYVIKVGASAYRPLRDIWVGALLASLALELLQSAGGLILTHELQRLDSLYGVFAVVLGLIFWLYLQTQILFLALEVDAVRVFRLWPRSVRAPLTPSDHKAYRLYAGRARFHEPPTV